MKTRFLLATVLATTCAIGAAQAAPPAKTMKASITSPSSPTAATIEISKASKFIVKVGSGSVTFAIKLSGVADKVGGAPSNVAGNALVVTAIVNNSVQVLSFPFAIANGSTTPTATLKFPVANSDAGAWGSTLTPGTPIEIVDVELRQGGTAQLFGVLGLTAQ